MKKKVVVFTGAGMSAESGIQTFRDGNGLWNNFRIEEVATPLAWHTNPSLVLEFYNGRRKNILDAKPNEAHFEIAKLEDVFDINIITQNIDDLHERAGSSNVLHLHGEIFKMRSETDSSLVYPIRNDMQLGDRAEDGEQLRPHIVWFGEEVPLMEPAIQIAMQAEVFIVIGSSLVVYPAASLLNYVPSHVQVIVIDKRLPEIGSRQVTYIEEAATEGVTKLRRMLL